MKELTPSQHKRQRDKFTMRREEVKIIVEGEPVAGEESDVDPRVEGKKIK